MLVDAINGETVEHIERSHPFGVTLGEVVVHGNDMNAVACECVEEHGEGGDEGLTFTGSHFCNLALMQCDTAEELHVVVYHFPFQVVASCCPVVVVVGFVAFDCHEVVLWI